MTLAEVLAAHQVKTPFDGVTCRACKWMAKDAYADHLVREIAAAGYSVVELPEPTVDDEWRDELLDWSVWPRRAYEADNALIVDASSALRPDNARRFAAALLAAADAAEHPGTPVEASQQETAK